MAASVQVACRVFSTDHHFIRVRLAGLFLFWSAFSIAILSLVVFLGLILLHPQNLRLAVLAALTLYIGFLSAVATTIATAIELSSTTEPDLLRCWLGVCLPVVGFAIGIMLNLPL